MRPAALAALVDALEQTPGNPSGSAPRARDATAAARRRPRRGGGDRRRRARRRGVHLRGHRGRQPGRGGRRCGDGAPPGCLATDHHAVLDPVRHRGGVHGTVGGRRPGRPGIAERPATGPTSGGVVGAGEQRDGGGPAARRGGQRHARAAARARWCTSTRWRPAAWLDLREPGEGRPTSCRSAATSWVGRRGSERSWCARHALAPCCAAAARSASVAAAPRTWRGPSAMAVASEGGAERAAATRRVARQRDRASGGLILGAGGWWRSRDGPAGAPRGCHTCCTCRAGACTARHCCSARRGGRGGLGGLELRQRRARALARARGARGARDCARGALRLSLGWSTTDAEVDHALAVVPRRGSRTAGAARGGSPVKVLVMMSGGVDSSVAAALLRDEGHDVVGVTLKLWGGESDSGCCSVSDVDDARRVADALGIDHHTFDFGDAFTSTWWLPTPPTTGRVARPNPCIECNRHLKFDAVLRRAHALGFDAVATGHHARIVADDAGLPAVARGADRAKDQSYVLHMLGQEQLARTCCRSATSRRPRCASWLPTSGCAPPPSPTARTCASSPAPRARLVPRRADPAHAGRVVDGDGTRSAQVTAVELVTIGQRRGLGLAGGGAPRYVVDVDLRPGRRSRWVGASDLEVLEQPVEGWQWSAGPVAGPGRRAGERPRRHRHRRHRGRTADGGGGSGGPSRSDGWRPGSRWWPTSTRWWWEAARPSGADGLGVPPWRPCPTTPGTRSARRRARAALAGRDRREALRTDWRLAAEVAGAQPRTRPWAGSPRRHHPSGRHTAATAGSGGRPGEPTSSAPTWARRPNEDRARTRRSLLYVGHHTDATCAMPRARLASRAVRPSAGSTREPTAATVPRRRAPPRCSTAGRRHQRRGHQPGHRAPMAWCAQTGDNTDSRTEAELAWWMGCSTGAGSHPTRARRAATRACSARAGAARGSPTTRATTSTAGPASRTSRDSSTRGAPVPATGLDVPWLAVFGNHDVLYQGTFSPKVAAIGELLAASGGQAPRCARVGALNLHARAVGPTRHAGSRGDAVRASSGSRPIPIVAARSPSTSTCVASSITATTGSPRPTWRRAPRGGAGPRARTSR
jgi:tRNA-uridine 2-sulfurtransferase